MAFKKNTITAFPTDTSFGLGVRADDSEALRALKALKSREGGKFFSLMVRDMEMLKAFAEVPADFPADFFTHTARTAILKPKDTLPKSEFWPSDKVAFRITTLPEVAQAIEYPITATSANLSGEPPIFSVAELQAQWGDTIEILGAERYASLPQNPPSEIWDLTASPAIQIR